MEPDGGNSIVHYDKTMMITTTAHIWNQHSKTYIITGNLQLLASKRSSVNLLILSVVHEESSKCKEIIMRLIMTMLDFWTADNDMKII